MKHKAKPMPKRSRPSRTPKAAEFRAARVPKAPDALRRAAEARLREKSATRPPKTEGDPARLQHDLRVHEVELEMQNEELRRTQAQLKTALQQYTEHYDFAPAGYLTLKPDGTILRANLAAASLLGIECPRLLGRRFEMIVAPGARSAFANLLTRALATQAPQVCEVQLATDDKPPLTIQLRLCSALGGRECGVALTDLTEHKRREEERELTLQLLDRINSCPSLPDLLQAVIPLLQEATGCEAVGIRLRDGEDFPYFQTAGFPPRFVQAENTLCTVDPQGQPVLECMCGQVLCGRFDPAKPCFTARGSFWTNSLTDLLAGATATDRQACQRNRCSSEGYESMAIVRLRTGGETFGLLQFNDRRRACFTPAKLAHLEQIADHLAVALARRQVEAALRETEQRHRTILLTAMDGFWRLDLKGRLLEVNEAYCRMSGYTEPELLAMSISDLEAAETPAATASHMQRVLARGEDRFETLHCHKDGNIFPVEVSVQYKPQQGAYLVVFLRDITQRKQAEETLHHLSARLLQLRDEERRHIARELHDSTVQDLAAVVVNLSFLRTALRRPSPEARQALLDSLGLAERAATGLRTLTYLLHPPLLQELGLAGTLRDFVDGFTRRSGIRVELKFKPAWRRIPEELELALFRVIQESLANIHRHSGSSSASITLCQAAAEVRLEVRDAGHGFILESSATGGPAPPLGVGITGMRERLRELGGHLTITSNSSGTTIRAILPCRRPEPAHPT